MAEFKYGSDVGVPSYNDIIAFERRSNIAFSVTSTTGGSHVSGSFHYKGNAVDTTSSAGQMQQLAAWLYNYAEFMLELIHSGGSGYFVKNGKKVAGSYYGASTISQHYNHVHCAMTLSGIAAALGTNPSGTLSAEQAALVEQSQQASGWWENKGCALPAASLGLTIVGGITTAIGAINGWF